MKNSGFPIVYHYKNCDITNSNSRDCFNPNDKVRLLLV